MGGLSPWSPQPFRMNVDSLGQKVDGNRLLWLDYLLVSVVRVECVFKVMRVPNPERHTRTTLCPWHFAVRETFCSLSTPPTTVPFLDFPFCLNVCSHDLDKIASVFWLTLPLLSISLSSHRCPSDYVGDRCQYPSPCSPSPCHNGGECQAVSHANTFDFRCVCRLGFTDRLCLTPANHACMNSPCRNGGTCELISLSVFRCRCPPGWSGMPQTVSYLLTWRIPFPLSDLTMNHLFLFVYLSGKTCQTPNPCASNPCANGGQCSALDSTYKCTCPPIFQGQTCKQDINECAQTPSLCLNGGICVNEVGSYHCRCPQEFTGQHCETTYQPCSPSPCLNGGTCVQKGETTLDCSCLPGKTQACIWWVSPLEHMVLLLCSKKTLAFLKIGWLGMQGGTIWQREVSFWLLSSTLPVIPGRI